MSTLLAAMTPSLLRERIVSAYAVWGQSRASQEAARQQATPTLRAILSGQTARIRELDVSNRIPKIEITWMEACQDTSQLRTGVFVRGLPCDFSGWQVGSNKMEILIDNQISETFDIPAELFDNVFTPEEMFNIGLNRAIRNIVKKLNAHGLANVVQWAGKNNEHRAFGVDGGVGTGNAWKTTKIPWLNTYEQSLNSYLARVASTNRLINPVLLEGGVLSLSEFVPGSLDAFAFGRTQVYSDSEAFGVQGVEDHMYYMASGAIALFTVANQTSTPRRYQAEGKDFIGVSRNLVDFQDANGNPIVYDLYVKRKMRGMDSVDFQGLNTDNRCEFVDSYRLEVNFKMVLNPLACADGVTGIIDLKSDNTLPAFMSPQQISRTFAYTPGGQ